MCCHSESHKEPYYLFDLEILLASHRNVSLCLYLDEAIFYRSAPYKEKIMLCSAQEKENGNKRGVEKMEKDELLP